MEFEFLLKIQVRAIEAELVSWGREFEHIDSEDSNDNG